MHKIFKTEWQRDASGIILKQRARKGACAWSTRNLVAFTTGFVETSEDDPTSSRIIVHIICPENPWEVYHLDTGLREPVEHIVWERTSTKLLIIDVCGFCKVFEMKNNLMNSWKCSQHVNLQNRIVCLAMLDQEARYLYEIKPGQLNFFEKFPRKFSEPPLSDIAGLSKNGFIAITEMGVAQVVLFEKDTPKGKVHKAKLFTNRSRVLLGDIRFKDDGKVHVVLATDQRVVEFFVLSLRMLNLKCDILFEISPCIVPHVMSDEEYPTYQITNVRFSNTGKADHILICTESESVTCLKYFELKIERATLQSVLQRMVQNPKLLNVKEWSCPKSYSFPGKISCLALSGVLTTGLDSMVYPSIVFRATNKTMYKIAATNLSEVKKVGVGSEDTEEFTCLAFSPCDTCVLAVTDKGNIVLYLVTSCDNINEPTAAKSVANLFQYCITTGQSSWDAGILCSSMGDSFAEQCHIFIKNELANQSVMVQERTFVAHSQVQADIYKGFRRAYHGTIESYDAILLKSIYYFLQSATSMSSSEKESHIMAKIRTVCSRKFDMELPKVVQLIEVKDVSFSLSLVSSTQYMTQWIANYAIRVCKLMLLSDSQANSKQIISTLSIAGLKTLRDLLVLLYVWGQALPGWQPHFLEFGSPLDIMSQIFKVVSKLCVKFMQGDYGKDSIISEEIPMRSNPVMYQNLPLYDPRSGIISQCQYLINDADVYTFDAEEETIASAARYKHCGPMMQQTEMYCIKPGEFFYDGINLITTSLLKGETLKQCTQCCCLTLSGVNPSRNLLTSWREQWLESCFCGGLWRGLSREKELPDVEVKNPVQTAST